MPKAELSAESAAEGAAAFGQLAAVLRRSKVRLWTNVELFCFENDRVCQPLLPAPFARGRRQLEAVAGSVEKIIGYQMPGLITSLQICPPLGVPATED